MQYLSIDNIFVNLYNDTKFINIINKKVGHQYLDDMLSELYLILVKMGDDKVNKLYNDNKLKNYLYVIVNNQMKKSCQNCFYRKFVIKDEYISDIQKDNLTVNESKDIFDQQEYIIERVKNMMLHLHPKKAVVFNLYYFENKNYREISEITNIKLGRIALWVNSALLDIKQQFKNDNNINNND